MCTRNFPKIKLGDMIYFRVFFLFFSVEMRLVEIFGFLLCFLIHITKQTESKAIIKDIGKISFYENIETIEYDLNLQPFFENAEAIFNGTAELTKICKNLTEDKNCNHYISNLNHQLEEVSKNINQVKSESRQKRNIWTSAGRQFFQVSKHVIPSTVFATGAATILVNINTEQKLLEAAQKRYSSVKKELNNTLILINVTSDSLDETSKALNKLNDKVNSKNRFMEILNTIQLGLTIHFKDAEIYSAILNGHLREQFFKIYNTEDFTKQIEKINKKLQPNFTLPNLDIFDLLEISTVFHIKNSTHIRIIVEIPILNREHSNLKSFVPIPYIENDQVYILNTDANFVFLHNDTLKIITKDNLKECINIDDFTMCNSMLTETLLLANPCIHSIFTNSYDDCAIKPIEPLNYFIETSDFSVYCFILKPFNLKISCIDDDIKIFNLSKSTELFYENHCEVYKISSEVLFNTSTYSTIDINYKYIKPNLSGYEENNQNGTKNIFPIDRFSVTLLEMYNNTKDLIKEMNPSNENTETKTFISNIWSTMKSIPESLNVMLSYINSNFIFWIFFPIIITILVICFCKRIIKRVP